MQRILALDIGDKRIGIAVSDPLGYTAQGLETYVRDRNDAQKDIDYILALANKYKPCSLLFGLPRNMDGSYGFQCDNVKDFASKLLLKWDGEHVYYDERLTSVASERVLIEADVRREKRRLHIDKLAAVIILQGYLESKRQEQNYGK